MRGEVHILVNCPITTFLREKQHSSLYIAPVWSCLYSDFFAPEGYDRQS